MLEVKRLDQVVRLSWTTGHPVYTFAGIATGFLFLIALFGSHLPVLIRAAVLAWLFVFGHIFWALC